MKSFLLFPALLAVAACAGDPVVQYRTITVQVPVPVSCIEAGTEPAPVVPINQRFTREEWDALSTDQREALVGANSVRRVIYENEAEVIFVACRGATTSNDE